MNRYLSIALLLVVTASANAAVNTYFTKVNTVDIGETTYKVWDMMVDVDSDWERTRMDLILTSGTLYQHSLPFDVEPNPGFYPMFLDMEWDTYLTVPGGFPAPVGLAGDPPYMSDTSITASWFDEIDSGPGVWRIAQVTLSSDAEGTISGWSTDCMVCTALPESFQYVIVDGEIVPEPATTALLALGGLALIRRRW